MAINRFYFTGEPFFPKQSDKFGFVIEGTSSSGNKYLRMNLGIKENEHNICFTEMFGMKTDVIKTMDIDNKAIEIKWNDRFDSDILDRVALYKKITINLDGTVVPLELKESLDDLGISYEESGNEIKLLKTDFITQYDAIKYLFLVKDYIKSRILAVGQYRINAYKGKFSGRYELQNVYTAKEKDKNGLKMALEVFFNKDSYDESDWKNEKIIGLDAYVPMYISKDEGTKFIPQRLVFNCSKVDTENEAQMKKVDWVKSFFKTKSSSYYRMPFNLKILNGSEEVEITYDMLTSRQKESIDLGFKTLDDYKKKTFGEKIQEIRIISPALEYDDFDEGMKETDETAKEFEEMIYTFEEPKTESIDEVIKESEEVPFDEKNESDDFEDMFG